MIRINYKQTFFLFLFILLVESYIIYKNKNNKTIHEYKTLGVIDSIKRKKLPVKEFYLHSKTVYTMHLLFHMDSVWHLMKTETKIYKAYD